MEKTKSEIALENVQEGIYWEKEDASRYLRQATRDFECAKEDIIELCGQERNPAMFLALLQSYTDNARRAYADITKYTEMERVLDAIKKYSETAEAIRK